MSSTIRRLPAFATALALALAIACAVAAPGAHATNLLTCPAGNSSGTYTPPLTNTPSLVSIAATVNYGTCVGLSPLTRTGSHAATGGPSLHSCTDLLESRSGVVFTIHWSTGTTSTVAADLFTPEYVTGGILQTTVTGTITAGEFTGAHLAEVSAVVGNAPLDCSAGGVSSASGPLTMVITP